MWWIPSWDNAQSVPETQPFNSASRWVKARIATFLRSNCAAGDGHGHGRPMDNVIMKHQIHLIGQKHCHIWFKLLSLFVAEFLVLQPWLTPIFGTFEPPEMSIQWLKTAISFNQMTIDSVNPPNLGYPNGSSACLQVFSHLLLLFHFFWDLPKSGKLLSPSSTNAAANFLQLTVFWSSLGWL